MLSMTIVENRRLDRSTRYTLYLNDGRGYCAELACGPTVDHVYTDAQVNLTGRRSRLSGTALSPWKSSAPTSRRRCAPSTATAP